MPYPLRKKMLTVGVLCILLATVSSPVVALQPNQNTTPDPVHTIHISGSDDQTHQGSHQDTTWMTLDLNQPSPSTPHTTEKEILPIDYTENIYVSNTGLATIDVTIDVPPSPLQELYKEMYGASPEAAVGQSFDIPEQSTVIQRETDTSVTVSKSNFYRSLREEHLYGLGMIAQPTAAYMVPQTQKNTFELTAQGTAHARIKDATTNAYTIGIGPYALETTSSYFDYQLSLIGYAKLMLKSMPGEQIFKRTWTTTIYLPEDSYIVNVEELNGKHWFIDFSEGTYMTASIEKTAEDILVVKEVLVISESDKIIPQPLEKYKTFDVELSSSNLSLAQQNSGAMPLAGSRGGFEIETDPIDIFDFELEYTFEESVFEATLTINLWGNATVYCSSDESWILLQAAATAELSVSFTLGVSGEKELFSWTGTPYVIHIQAGPVPIDIFIYYGVNIGIEYGIELSTTVSAMAGVSTSIKVGAHYDWEWGPSPKIRWHKIWEADFTPFYDLPGLDDIETEFTAWVTPYIEFPVSARLYSLFGPQIKPKIYLKASIGYAFTWDDPSGTLDFSWSIRLGFSIWVGVVVGIPDVLEYEFGFDIVDFTIHEWTSDDPGDPGTFPPSLDTDPPVTSLVVNAPPVFVINNEYWTGQNLSFSFAAVDEGKVPTGVNRTKYYAGTNQNGGTYQTYTPGAFVNVTTYPDETTPGYYSYYINYYSVDNTSQYETIQQETINVDFKPPTSALQVPDTVYAYQTPLTIIAHDWDQTFDGTGYFIMYRIGHDGSWTDWIRGADNTSVVLYVTHSGLNTIQWFATDGVWNSQHIHWYNISNVQLSTYSTLYPYHSFSTVTSGDLSYHYSSDPTWDTSTVYFDVPQTNTYRCVFGSVKSYHSTTGHVVNIFLNDSDIDEWILFETVTVNNGDSNWHSFDFRVPSDFHTNKMMIYSSENTALLNVTDGLMFYDDVAPVEPWNPTPADGAINIPNTNVVLQWKSGDPDNRDLVWYSVSLGESPNSLSWKTTLGPYPYSQTTFSWNYTQYFGWLENQKTYYWRIRANDSFNTPVNGPIWRFTTQAPPLTVYVDDNFGPSTPGYGDTKFSSVQQGVNRIREGGTVYVYNGKYIESVEIHKRLSLLGNGSTTSFIDGGAYGSVLLIDADDVNVSGFTFRYGVMGVCIYAEHAHVYRNTINWSDTGVCVNGAWNNVSQNNITDVTDTGILLTSSCHHTTLWENRIYNIVHDYGIHVHESTNNSILNNHIWGINDDGIYLDTYSGYCLVKGNNVQSPDDAIRVDPNAPHHVITRNNVNGSFSGILIGSDNTSVTLNTAVGGWYGICVWSNYNNVQGNTVRGSNYHGIFASVGTNHNNISLNNATDSGHSGIYLEQVGKNNSLFFNHLGTPETNQLYGMYLHKSHYVTLSNNTAEYNDRDGYYFADSDFNLYSGNVGYANGGYNLYLNASQRNTITSNQLYGSNYGGIIMEDICCYNTIMYNSINGNLNGSGISIAGDSNNNTIRYNTLLSNNQGITLLSSWRNKIWDNTIDGQCNPTQGFYPIGIYLGACYQNNISFNNISTNHYGVYITSSSGGNPYYYRPNTIFNNTFTANDDSPITSDDYAIIIHESTRSNPVMNNTIIGGSNSHGILIDSSTNQTISSNTFQNTGITIKGDEVNQWTKHTISYNTANGQPIRYYKGGTNATVPAGTAQVIFGNCKNMTVQGLSLGSQRVDIPIQLGFSNDNKILQNNLVCNPSVPNDYGISLYRSVRNNISGNTISSHLFDGILLQSYSDLNTLYANTITLNDRSGIRLQDSWSNTISKNVQIDQNGGEGIYLNTAGNNAITNNYQIKQNAYGIRSISSYATLISSNIVEYNIYGIRIDNSQSATITDNDINNNDHGVFLENSYDLIIRSNNFTLNAQGVENYYPGIPLLPSIIAHNNFVANTQQAFDNSPAGKTIWNDTYLYNGNLTPPFALTAGNYWSDFLTGQDGFHGASQNIAGADSVQDLAPGLLNPRPIQGGPQNDWYPYITPLLISCGPQQPFNNGVIENPGRDVFTGGHATWTVDYSTFIAGDSSARSGVIGNSKISVLKTSVDGPGTLAFYWKVSSQNLHDLLVFTIDDKIQTWITGSVSWQLKNYPVGVGHHEISWTYVKDSNDVSGSDCGWVDNVVWVGHLNTPGSPSPANNSVDVSINSFLNWTGGDPDAGDTVTYSIYMGTSPSLSLKATIGPYPASQTALSYNPGTLDYGTSYFWKIVATDNHGTTKQSPAWHFTTDEEFSLAAYWPFDEGTGSTVHDQTLNYNNGSISGATWTTGYFGSALYFHGGGQYVNGDGVTIPHSSSLNIIGPFSISAWINASGSDNYLVIVDKYQYTGGNSYGFTMYLNDGKLRFSIYSGPYGSGGVMDSTGNLRDNKWHLVRGTYNNGLCSIYVDGEKRAEAAWAYPPASTTNSLGIGKRLSGWGGYLPFLGKIDDVRITRLDTPTTPTNPSPVDGAANQPVSTILSWTGGDPNHGDIVSYDVYLDANDPTPDTLISKDQTNTSYDPPGDLLPGTTYYWRVFAQDNHGQHVLGPIWMFTTQAGPANQPPYTPTDPYPVDGAIDQSLTVDVSWTGGDPDTGDLVSYDVYFECNDPTPDTLVSEHQTSTTYDPGGLVENSIYYWRIVASDNHGASTSGPVWSFSTMSNTLHVQGNCTYSNQSPAEILSVEIINLNTSCQWFASSNDNQYSLALVRGQDVVAGNILRFIARDYNESVNVTDHIFTTMENTTGVLTLHLVVRIHYRDLKSFPWHLSTVNTGAMTMKMMMDYLMWNSTTHPQGPPSVYSEQTLYNIYKGADSIINGTELCTGLNAEVDDHGHGWIYGYFFAPYASTNSNDVLKQICVWLDYPVDYYNDIRDVDVPKPGHPNHVPIAVPTHGNYNNWMVVRGIHTDRNSWLPPEQLTVYGFWLNDPNTGGLGSNTYVTTQRFLSTYFATLNVPGDTYNGKYLAITDPSRDIPADTRDTTVTFAETPAGFTVQERKVMSDTKLSTGIKENIIQRTAYIQAMNVLRYDPLGDVFEQARPIGKPCLVDNAWTVVFSSTSISFKVLITQQTGTLLEIQIQKATK